jgi:hypothetical protein
MYVKEKRRSKSIINGDFDRPISDAYPVIDTDLARDNIENDLPDADIQDLCLPRQDEEKR